jgi:hypothetical protein
MSNLATYDDEMLFVANDAERSMIGSTTDGVTPKPDGSLTVYIHQPRLKGGERVARSRNSVCQVIGGFQAVLGPRGARWRIVDASVSVAGHGFQSFTQAGRGASRSSSQANARAW